MICDTLVCCLGTESSPGLGMTGDAQVLTSRYMKRSQLHRSRVGFPACCIGRPTFGQAVVVDDAP